MARLRLKGLAVSRAVSAFERLQVEGDLLQVERGRDAVSSGTRHASGENGFGVGDVFGDGFRHRKVLPLFSDLLPFAKYAVANVVNKMATL